MNNEENIEGKKKTKRSITDILTGKFLMEQDIVAHLPYLLFITLLAIIYIGNGYYAEDTIRQINKTNNKLKELQSEYISTKFHLMFKSKQSEVVKIVEEKGLGLQVSVVPPKKIVISKTEYNNVKED